MIEAIYVKLEPGPSGSNSPSLVPADEMAAVRISKIPLGEIIAIRIVRERSAPMHRLFFAILRHIAENTEFETERRLLVALKIRLGFYDVERIPLKDGGWKAVPVPQSIAFDKMDQDAFTKFFHNALRVLCDEVLGGYDQEKLIREVEGMLGLPPLEIPPRTKPAPRESVPGTGKEVDRQESQPETERSADPTGAAAARVSSGDRSGSPEMPDVEFKAGMTMREKVLAFEFHLDGAPSAAWAEQLRSRHARQILAESRETRDAINAVFDKRIKALRPDRWPIRI